MSHRSSPAKMAIAAVALALAACGPAGSAPDAPTRPTPATTAVSTATPPEAIALRDDAVVVLEAATGAVVDEHAVDPGAGLSHLELVAVRDLVLLTRQRGGDAHELVAVDLGEGRTRVHGRGRVAAATSDGERLAYVHDVPGPAARELVSTTWDGSELDAWPIEASPAEELTVTALAWSPTGEELVVSLRTVHGPEVRVLPVDRGGTLRGASEALPPTSAGAHLHVGTFRRPGVVTVAESCCGDTPDRWRVLDVQLGTETVTELLTDLDGPIIQLDWTAGHDRLLVTDGDPGRLLAWHASTHTEVTDDVAGGQW